MLMTTGCVSTPSMAPVPEFVRQSSNDYPSGVQSPSKAWWASLHDQGLNALIGQGLRHNPSAHIALARLAQAESSLKVATSARWPSLFGLGSRTATHVSGQGTDTRSDLGALTLSWDPGLWGKRRLEIEEARQFKHQRWFEDQSVRLALSASIAEIYFEIVEQRMQGNLLKAQLSVSNDLEELVEARFRRGQARASEMYQQRESTQTLRQLKIVNDTDLEALEKSLDVLLGAAPDAISRVTNHTVPTDLAGITPGKPEDLIKTRADIRAGYARLQQVAALAGLRLVERLPSLNVTANLTSLAQKSMSSTWFGYGIDLSVPIFTGGRLRALEAQALHRLEEERQTYHALWLSALEEVGILHWQYERQQLVIATLQARRGFAQQALTAARNRYVFGDQNYLDVLTALRGLQDADRLLIAEQHLLVKLWIQAMAAIGQPMCPDAACEGNWAL